MESTHFWVETLSRQTLQIVEMSVEIIFRNRGLNDWISNGKATLNAFSNLTILFSFSCRHIC